MGPSHDNLFVGYTEDQFSIGTTALILSSIWSLLWPLYRRYFLCQRGIHSIYTRCQFLSLTSTTFQGSFWLLWLFYQCFSRKQRSMHQCVLQSLIVFCRRYLSSLPSQDKNSILFSHFPILHRLCGDDTDFLKKREALSKQAITSINKLVDNYVTAGKGRSNIPLTLAFQPITQWNPSF